MNDDFWTGLLVGGVVVAVVYAILSNRTIDEEYEGLVAAWGKNT